MKKILFLPIFLVVSMPFAFADDIIMTTDQDTFYFKVGEEAVIPLKVDNNLGQSVSGTLEYSITQDIIQGNTHISSSNSNANSMNLKEGHQEFSLDFGTSTSSATIEANLNFSYNDGEDKQVLLGPINIVFVADDSQKNNTQNQMQSTTQKGPPQSNQFNPQQSIQQQFNDMMRNQQLPQNPQQRLQNSQMDQDSSALKQEIQNQVQKDNQLKSNLGKLINADPQFQKLNQQLQSQGYNFTNGSINSTTNSTGTFEANYQNSQGKWAKIQGTMKNGTMTDIQKQTQQEQEDLMAKLRADPRFQDYEKQLAKEGYSEQGNEFNVLQNKTSIVVDYQNQETQKATINADFVNDELTQVQLNMPRQNIDFWPFLAIAAVAAAAIVLYLKLRLKKKVAVQPVAIPIPEKEFEYTMEASRLLDDAKEHYRNQQFKDAYSKLNQCIRLFLSHKLDLKKEITNEALLEILKNTPYPLPEIQTCFSQSSLVEFAKNPPNQDEFEKMVGLAESILRK